MNTYDSTISMMNNLPDNDLLLVKEFANRLIHKNEIKREMYNPYKPLTREEIIEQLNLAKKNADNGKIIDAQVVSNNIRSKYGL